MHRKSRPTSLLPHPAPEDLRPVQDLLNTLDLETGSDTLTTPEALNRWLKRWKLLGENQALSEEEWRSALQVRHGLREWFQDHQHGGRVKAEILAALTEVTSAVELRYQLRIEADGSARLVCQSEGWPAVLVRLFEPLIEGMRDGRFWRLKVCAEETCGRAFYDASRSHTGKWCNGLRCGNRASAKTYRSRQRRQRRRA